MNQLEVDWRIMEGKTCIRLCSGISHGIHSVCFDGRRDLSDRRGRRSYTAYRQAILSTRELLEPPYVIESVSVVVAVEATFVTLS